MNQIPWWLPSATALFIAVLGIFQEQIRKALFGPKLSLWFDAYSLVDSHMTSITLERATVEARQMPTVDNIPTFWIRLRVVNAGSIAAHGVRVIVKELWQKDSRGRYQRDAKFTPMNLKWTNVGEPTLDVLPPKLEQFCDLLHVPDPGRIQTTSAPIPDAQAFLELQVHPNARPGILEAGRYALVLLVVATDAAPQQHQIEFAIPRQWSANEAEMQRAIDLRGLPTVSPLEPLLPSGFSWRSQS